MGRGRSGRDRARGCTGLGTAEFGGIGLDPVTEIRGSSSSSTARALCELGKAMGPQFPRVQRR